MGEWQSGLIQQIPWGVIMVYVMERFLKHLNQRDATLSRTISEFTVAVREMSKEVHTLALTVTRMDTRFRS